MNQGSFFLLLIINKFNTAGFLVLKMAGHALRKSP
jgi:hypothetical protein